MYAGIGLPPDHLKKYANMRSKFQDAWLDYISLQRIDYKTSFSCKCCNQVKAGPDDRYAASIRRLTLRNAYQPGASFFLKDRLRLKRCNLAA